MSKNAARYTKQRREVAGRGCRAKARYATFHEADRIRRRCEEARGAALRVYDCEGCGGWHLTGKIQGDPTKRRMGGALPQPGAGLQ